MTDEDIKKACSEFSSLLTYKTQEKGGNGLAEDKEYLDTGIKLKNIRIEHFKGIDRTDLVIKEYEDLIGYHILNYVRLKNKAVE